MAAVFHPPPIDITTLSGTPALRAAYAAELVGVLAASRICTQGDRSAGMRRASTWMLGKGTQTPSPSPDLIPAATKDSTEPETLIRIGTARGDFTPASKARAERPFKTWMTVEGATTSGSLGER
jgi:hypothetical protein